jgi:redox-sensitive bicupin YhaK (pirin superfamily)
MAYAVEGKSKDLGGFQVTRLLPQVGQRSVGPFVFLDRMGPADFDAGHGIDVRPHPHIGLSTLTYLFEGAILHRDSVGSVQEIHPGDVNWMTAGRGITHSERESPAVRGQPHKLDGAQFWIALPEVHEEIAPSFTHVPKADVPAFDRAGAHLRLVAGSAYGHSAPVPVHSPLFLIDAHLPAGATLPPPDGAEVAVHVVAGSVSTGGRTYATGALVVLEKGDVLHAGEGPARYLVFGGQPLGMRHMWWNFVSSRKERIEQAKADWDADRFPKVAGDAVERIPLPKG